MPSYAGFKDLTDYLTQRCRERGVSFNALGEDIGKGHAYIYAVTKGRFLPSAQMADTIAEYFGDNPRMVRILAGIELPPTEEDKLIAETKELAATLPTQGRRELRDYAKFLQSKYNKTNGH